MFTIALIASKAQQTSQPMSAFPITLLQLTDTHLCANPEVLLKGVATRRALEQVIAAAAGELADITAVLVTGDVAHDGSAAAYRQFERAIAVFEAPVYCIPGNHDDPALMGEILCPDSVRWPVEVGLGDWQVLLLNSHVTEWEGGELSSAELRRLEAVLQRSEAAHVLIVVHHPPVAVGSRWLDDIGLANGEALFEVARRDGRVRGILWGHIHQQFEGERDGIKLMGTPSTCVQFAPRRADFAVDGQQPPAYRWLRLHADGCIDSEVRWVDAALC